MHSLLWWGLGMRAQGPSVAGGMDSRFTVHVGLKAKEEHGRQNRHAELQWCQPTVFCTALAKATWLQAH